MNKSLVFLLSICSLLLLSACGGGNTSHQSPATHFSVTAPATAAPKTAFSFTVTALDASNNTVTGYSGTVHFTSTDGQAVLAANSALTTGTALFLATLKTVGSQTIMVTDTRTPSITGTSNSIKVSVPGLAITSGPPPPGTVGVKYGTFNNPCMQYRLHSYIAFDLTASGGKPPYFWSDSSAPAPGLGITDVTFMAPPQCPFFSVPVISGTPTAAGSFNVTLTVTDSGSPAAQTSASYTIMINAAQVPAINTTPLPSSGAANRPYSFTFTATGGIPPHTWSQLGALPSGLVLNDSGVLSGTPKVAGSFPITVNMQDTAGQSAAPQEFKIRVFLHGFGATGSMSTARASHTATLLNDGRMLVTGGLDANGKPVSTAELFDSTAKSFSGTGSMGIARSEHTATLLNDGIVLVTGGIDADGKVLATAEVYDPATRSFSRTGSMASARFSHTATLLKDGKVLVTGGSDGAGNKLASAELFDPATASFSPTGNMETARFYHTATPLNNGKVLLTGGADDNGNALASAELFDFASGTFMPTGSMETARTGHAALLLNDGTVLVTGGTDQNADLLIDAEVFDFASGTFMATGSMQTARSEHTATLLTDGEVLVTGGSSRDVTGHVTSLATAELFQ